MNGHPWEEQDWETAYALFQAYLVLPIPRRLTDLVAHTYTRNELKEVARLDAWEQRADLYDRHLCALRQETVEAVLIESAQDMARRQGKAWRKVFEIASKDLAKLEALVDRPGGMPWIPVPVALKALNDATKNERLIMGQATDRVESGVSSQDPDLSMLSNEEIETLRQLQTKIAKGR